MNPSKLLLPLITFSIFNYQIGVAAPSTNISGFLTAGVAYSDNETPYLRAGITDDQPNYEQDTVLGVQLDTILDQNTRLSAQFIANNKEGTDFDTNAEWLYVSRNLGKHTTARLGRLRVPIHLYSQQLFVGGSYIWLRPPQEVYNLLASISNFTGTDITFNLDSGIGSTSLQLYTGKITEKPLIILGQEASISTNQLFGAVGRFDAENLSLFLSYTRLDANISGELSASVPLLPPPSPPFLLPVSVDIASDSEVVTFGFQYNIGNVELLGEHAQRLSDDLGDSTGWYTTAAYNMDTWTPYITLAQADSGAINTTSGLGSLVGGLTGALQLDSESITLGLRKSLSPKVSINAELHSAEAKHGTKGLFTGYQGFLSTTSATPELEDPDVLMFSFAVNVLF